jgi:hypothetical protein
MQRSTIIFSENILMSVAGHLVVAALIILSLAAVAKRAATVASDRVQIMEIDLSAIRITKDLTELYNLETVDSPKSREPDKKPDEQSPAPADDPKPLEKPTLVDGTEPPPVQKKPKPAEKPKPDPSPEQPKRTIKKQTVRVNRETLTRTMTVSVSDALRAALTRCWVIDNRRDDLNGLRVVAHLAMLDNGMVRDMWVEEATRANDDPGFAYALETIKTAIKACQPFKMLPQSEFAEWAGIQLVFYPSSATIK